MIIQKNDVYFSDFMHFFIFCLILQIPLVLIGNDKKEGAESVQHCKISAQAFHFPESGLPLSPNSLKMIFSRSNYLIMLGGIALILVGFLIMTMEDAEYGFGPKGLTIGPSFLMIGFLIEIYAILHKEKSSGEESWLPVQ